MSWRQIKEGICDREYLAYWFYVTYTQTLTPNLLHSIYYLPLLRVSGTVLHAVLCKW
jgi:hypothetical protein